MHNFVLAHPTCNRSKSNLLAAKEHLERWVDYVNREDQNLKTIGSAAGKISDLSAMYAVARWGYASAVQSSAQAWVKSKVFESVGREYLRLF